MVLIEASNVMVILEILGLLKVNIYMLLLISLINIS